jgi:hypothetical protein
MGKLLSISRGNAFDERQQIVQKRNNTRTSEKLTFQIKVERKRKERNQNGMQRKNENRHASTNNKIQWTN